MENKKPGTLLKAVKRTQIASVVSAALALANELLYYPLALTADRFLNDGFAFFMFFGNAIRAAWSIATLAMGGWPCSFCLYCGSNSAALKTSA